MNKIKIKHYKGIIWIVSFLAILSIFFLFVDPKNIVASLGVTNSYLVLFFVAMIGGASSFTSSSYYATIVTFAMSGLDPFVMALVAGTGLTISDTVFYLIGSWGRNNISGPARVWFEKYSQWFSEKPKIVIQGIVYVYTGFLPLPGDVLMMILSFSRFPIKSFIIPAFLGNITMVLLLTLGVIAGTKLL